jgi:hypothetical protein
MEWIIKKNATLPIFQIEIAKDGRSDFGRNQDLLNSTFYISLYDEITKKFKVSSKPCYITYSSSTVNSEETFYYLNYNLTNRETNSIGRYLVQISIQDSTGTIVLPLKEKIYISVLESFSLDYQTYFSNYVIERPCCNNEYTPEVFTCLIDIVTEIGFDLITEDGVLLVDEIDNCPPLPCDISVITENGFSLITEYGVYLIDDIDNCPPSPCDISITNESGASLISEYGAYLIEEETIC